MDKVPMTPAGHAALTEEYRFRTSEERPRIVARHFRSPRPWRSQRKRRVSRRQGAAEPQRGPHPGTRGPAGARRHHRRQQAVSGSTVKFGATVKIVDEDTEKEAQLHDRRRRRSRRQQGPHLDLLADRPRHDRQVQGRQRRSPRPRRHAQATRSSKSGSSRRAPANSRSDRSLLRTAHGCGRSASRPGCGKSAAAAHCAGRRQTVSAVTAAPSPISARIDVMSASNVSTCPIPGIVQVVHQQIARLEPKVRIAELRAFGLRVRNIGEIAIEIGTA